MNVIHWIVAFLIAVCVFFIAQWLIPLICNLIGLHVPANIVNIFALLIAVGGFFGWNSYGWRFKP